MLEQIAMTLEEIYAEYHKMVFNLALHYVQNSQDAEEITQDVFVKVYGSLNGFKNKSSLKTWIYRITINQSLDFIKSYKTQKRNFFSTMFRLNETNLQFEPTYFNHPGIELEQKEALRLIFQAINQLNDKQKTALILLKIEGKSQSETAEIMKLNVKAIESLFQRAKKNLEILLNSKG
jgi:RNA polymerase sigma factor (sigma-70 family)